MIFISKEIEGFKIEVEGCKEDDTYSVAFTVMKNDKYIVDCMYGMEFKDYKEFREKLENHIMEDVELEEMKGIALLIQEMKKELK